VNPRTPSGTLFNPSATSGLVPRGPRHLRRLKSPRSLWVSRQRAKMDRLDDPFALVGIEGRSRVCIVDRWKVWAKKWRRQKP
jgi:hypothetical protein